MRSFRYLLPAEEEMTEAALFYEKQATGLGLEFLDDVQNSIDHLIENPNLGHVLIGNLRRSLLSRFPYCLIYSIETNGLVIIAVAHQRRQPYFWKDRI